MSEPAFTPGPWTLTQHAKFADTQMYWVNGETSVGTAVEADARLIAAAPELYEALERLVPPASGLPELLVRADVALARAALAKARGDAK